MTSIYLKKFLAGVLITGISICFVEAKDYDLVYGKQINGMNNTHQHVLTEVPKQVIDVITKITTTRLDENFNNRYNNSLSNMEMKLEKNLLNKFKILAYQEEAQRKVLEEIKIKEKLLIEREARIRAKEQELERRKEKISNNLIKAKVEEVTRDLMRKYLVELNRHTIEPQEVKEKVQRERIKIETPVNTEMQRIKKLQASANNMGESISNDGYINSNEINITEIGNN